jgi:hypothetical protein
MSYPSKINKFNQINGMLIRMPMGKIYGLQIAAARKLGLRAPSVCVEALG